MAKKRPRPTANNMTKEEAKAIATGVVPTIEKEEKKATPKRNHKVLYVSPAHHQKAKKNAYNKGFSKMREYIEYLIEQDQNI